MVGDSGFCIRRLRGLLCVIAAGTSMLLIAGCQSARTTSFDVVVYDVHYNIPIEGVQVIAQTPSRDHPFSIATLLGQTGPFESRGITNDAGCVRLQGVADRSLRITVINRGSSVRVPGASAPDWRDFTIGSVWVDLDPRIHDPSQWLLPFGSDVGDETKAKIQVRLTE